LSAIDLNIKQEKYTMLLWRRLSESKPREGERCLVVFADDIVEADYKNGALCGGGKIPHHPDSFWTRWPEPPNE